MSIDSQTLVLVDNSFSVSKVNREITKETLKYLFSHSMEGRAYCFTPFSHTMDYAESYTVDYIGLEDMASRLEYENKEASITDVLTSVLAKWEESDYACRNIIILTDGLEEESIYYEREELFYLLEHNSYPVYIVCLDQKDNSEVVKNLSAICRVSGGQLFHSEFPGSDAEVERQISEQIFSAMEKYKSENWDIYENENVEQDSSEEILEGDELEKLPENEITDVIVENMPVDPVNTGLEGESEIIYDISGGENVFTPVTYGLVGLFLFLSICGVFLSWCMYIKHRQKVKKEEDEYRDRIMRKVQEVKSGNFSQERPSRMGETVSILRRSAQNDDRPDTGTRLLYEGMGECDLTFEDTADPSKYFRITSHGRITLGRTPSSCDLAFEYDDSVSGRHCEMYQRDEYWYVRDLNSSNGTFVNGEKVYTELEVHNGDMLKLGSLSLLVRFS